MMVVMNAIVPALHPLLNRVQQGARWVGQDEYPAWPDVAAEHERWLEFVSTKGELGRFLPRLRDRAAQRDDTLAEIGAGFFLEKQGGLPIVGWEPAGANGKTGEYLVRLPDGRGMFVEVKAPGWEQELVEAEGPQSPRLRRPKYLHAEARSTAPWNSVREAVKKAYPKVPDTMPTMVIIHDDLMVSLSDWGETIGDIALYCPRGKGHHSAGYLAEDGPFVGTAYERLGAVGVLNVTFAGAGATYRFSIYGNPNCLPRVAVPVGAFPHHYSHITGSRG